jgi:hypothetical protein
MTTMKFIVFIDLEKPAQKSDSIDVELDVA